MSYCNLYGPPGSGKDSIALQYRKRYELLQHEKKKQVKKKFCYNTASGMNCCNKAVFLPGMCIRIVTIPQAV